MPETASLPGFSSGPWRHKFVAGPKSANPSAKSTCYKNVKKLGFALLTVWEG
jgi:hypothetical protein